MPLFGSLLAEAYVADGRQGTSCGWRFGWREAGREGEARDLLVRALASTNGGGEPVVAEGRRLAEEAGARPAIENSD